MFKPIRLAALASVALLAACESHSTVATSGSQTVNLDLSQLFREMSVPGLSAAASAAGGLTAPSASVVPSGCTYSSASQTFACNPVTTNGLTITQSYTLLGASGNSLATFDASTVSSVRMRTTVVGTTTVNGDAITINQQGDQTLSGLQTSTHTLNGTNVSTMTGTLRSGPVTGPMTINSTMTITNLVLPATTGGYPASGTVAMNQTSSIGSAPPFTSLITMTYNGTSRVRVTISVNGVVLPGCSTIDLASSTPSCS